jgi:hypothetical protein
MLLRSSSLVVGVATAAAAALVALPSAAGAATPYSSPSGRAHSRVVTYDRGTVRIGALQAAVTRTGGHLDVVATVKVKNLSAKRVTRFVRAGRCVSGALAAPACKADVLFSFSLAGGGEGTIVRRFALRQPPSKVDAIELAVQAPRRRPAYFSRTDGELLLRGNAWRGAGAGATYGVTFPAGDDRAKRLSFDLPVTGSGRAYADVIWTGTSAPAAPTTLGKCTGTACLTAPLPPARSRSGAQMFGNRFGLKNDGHSTITLAVNDTDGTPLLSAALPWPSAV